MVAGRGPILRTHTVAAVANNSGEWNCDSYDENFGEEILGTVLASEHVRIAHAYLRLRDCPH